MLKTALFLMVTLSGSAFAQINSHEFVDCFEKAVNDVIVEIKEEGGDTTRICDRLSDETKSAIAYKYTMYVDDGVAVPYPANIIGKYRMIDFYDYLKDEMDCYGLKVEDQNGSLAGALLNSRSYHRNLNLTERALDKMISAEMWDKFLSPSAYDTLNEFDLSYCKE